MLGTGSIILTHDTGWSCANEAIMGMEFDPKPDKSFKATTVIDIRNLFNCIGETKGRVLGIFKLDGGDKVAFTGNMLGRSKIIIQGETNKDFQIILKSIEKWQEQYQVS